ncbi:hypothetical protein PI125_g14864 [Phytophthora idaei]|nr:hypothetical protein PI125_g14864 [Phytophthora idaei]
MSTAKLPLTIGVIVFDGVMQQDYVGVTTNSLGFGMPLYATHGFEDVTEHIDILVIPGGSPGRLAMQKNENFIKFLKGAADTATHVLTVCTGSAILATTGLLDGKRATTNKMAYQSVVEAHPTVHWVHKARWKQDGKIWTSSGVTAGWTWRTRLWRLHTARMSRKRWRATWRTCRTLTLTTTHLLLSCPLIRGRSVLVRIHVRISSIAADQHIR